MNYGDGTLNHAIRNFDLFSLGVRTQLSYSRTIASRDRVGNRTADILDDGTTTTTKSLAFPERRRFRPYLVEVACSFDLARQCHLFPGARNPTSPRRTYLPSVLWALCRAALRVRCMVYSEIIQQRPSSLRTDLGHSRRFDRTTANSGLRW